MLTVQELSKAKLLLHLPAAKILMTPEQCLTITMESGGRLRSAEDFTWYKMKVIIDPTEENLTGIIDIRRADPYWEGPDKWTCQCVACSRKDLTRAYSLLYA